ncbi:hypothetical protein Zmor_017019 [Zophobas morio]|uniref:Uncharacterized protein n=1 Tax=Zophobas morio TaxID=2755281 RepID=A0AA38I8W8_9CUCU|nr:hypothetical protein Zmor_017019 [Zophobas morio]
MDILRKWFNIFCAFFSRPSPTISLLSFPSSRLPSLPCPLRSPSQSPSNSRPFEIDRSRRPGRRDAQRRSIFLGGAAFAFKRTHARQSSPAAPNPHSRKGACDDGGGGGGDDEPARPTREKPMTCSCCSATADDEMFCVNFAKVSGGGGATPPKGAVPHTLCCVAFVVLLFGGCCSRDPQITRRECERNAPSLDAKNFRRIFAGRRGHVGLAVFRNCDDWRAMSGSGVGSGVGSGTLRGRLGRSQVFCG